MLQTQLNRRYRELGKWVIAYLNNPPDVWKIMDTVQVVQSFLQWFNYQVQLTIYSPNKWWDEYVNKVYSKGLGRAYDSINGFPNNDVSKVRKVQFLQGMSLKLSGTNGVVINASNATNLQPRDVRGRFISQRLHLLSMRLESEITGATTKLSQEVARELLDGMGKGNSESVIAKAIARRIGIGRTRAFAIARTEITRIHAEAQLDGLEELGIEEVQAQAEWVSGSGKPCPLCEPMVGAVLKIKEARGLIPRHVNCYCAWLPITGGKPMGKGKGTGKRNSQVRRSDKKNRKTQKRQIQRAISKSIKAERGDTDWKGEDINIETRNAMSEFSNWVKTYRRQSNTN